MNGVWVASAAAVAFVVTALAGKWGIPLLQKLKLKQPIYETGPNWHKEKQGTPTMGGILFIIGTVCAILILLPAWIRSNGFAPMEGMAGISGESRLQKTRIYGGLLMAIGFAAVGFLDDSIKVFRGQNLGLRAGQKLMLQMLIGAMYLFSLYLAGENGTTAIPWLGTVSLGWCYWPLALFVLVGTVNAVNLTDGIDGLAASVTLWNAVFFLVGAMLLSSVGTGIAAAAVVGGCAGFLLYNFHPACVFMGDTGSMFLGGMIATLGFALGMPVLILPVGIVYVLEALSDILQIGYFKLTHGKRIFRMAPLHHHLELCGWSEEKIVLVLNAVTIAGGVLALIGILFG